MTFKEIQDLIRLVNKSGLSEFKMKNGDFNVSIRTKNYSEGHTQIVQAGPAMMPLNQGVPAATPPAATETDKSAAAKEKKVTKDESKYLEVKSPIVGTFYRSSAPDKDSFVKVGDTIALGDTVCIIEAMKLFNEIETEVAGKIVKVMIEDASPVEYDQVLFLVDPKG